MLLSAREFSCAGSAAGAARRHLSRAQLEDRLFGWGEELEATPSASTCTSFAASSATTPHRARLGYYAGPAKGTAPDERAPAVRCAGAVRLHGGAGGGHRRWRWLRHVRQRARRGRRLFDYQLRQMALSLRDQGPHRARRRERWPTRSSTMWCRCGLPTGSRSTAAAHRGTNAGCRRVLGFSQLDLGDGPGSVFAAATLTGAWCRWRSRWRCDGGCRRIGSAQRAADRRRCAAGGAGAVVDHRPVAGAAADRGSCAHAAPTACRRCRRERAAGRTAPLVGRFNGLLAALAQPSRRNGNSWPTPRTSCAHRSRR